MSYRVEITPQAARQIRSLPRDILKRIDAAILSLAENPRPANCLKLQDSDNAWRVRVGDYRVIYEIEDGVLRVVVIRVDHRSTVYRPR